MLCRTVTEPPGLPAKASALSVLPPVPVTHPSSRSAPLLVAEVPLAAAVVVAACALAGVPSVVPAEETPEYSRIENLMEAAAPEIPTVTVLAPAAQFGSAKI